jgi:hypothetical protein
MKFSSLFILLSFILSSLHIVAQEIHVAKNGKDSNPGTQQQPVATLEAARDIVRLTRNKLSSEPVKVLIHQGVYELHQSLSFNELDAGTVQHPVTWMAAPGENVTISGGKSLDGNKFKPTSNKTILGRLAEPAQKNVVEIDLKKAGISNFGELKQYGHGLPVTASSIELFINNEPMNLARYPNKGAMKIGKVQDKGSVPRNGDKTGRGALFSYTDDRHKKWSGIPDIWIQGTLNYGYADDFNPIESIDTVKGLVKLEKPHLYGVASGKDFQEYVAINILEELDEPGEWYLNRKTGMLYLWPPSQLNNSKITISILEDPILALEGVSHIQFKNITFEVGRGIGIYIERSHHTLIAGCTVRNVGTAGIFMGQGAKLLDEKSSIDDYVGEPQSRQIGSFQNHIYANTTWNRNAGHHNGILSCDVYNTGSGGISLSGGDKKTLEPGNSYVRNCRISNYTRRNKFTYAGIRVDGCGNKVQHNEIFNSDWHGIFVHGNDHIFEFNYIHDVTLNSDDTSPWYIGRNPSDRGNIVRYNFFDHCGSRNRMNMGIYCDDSSADVLVFGNIFNDMQTSHGVLFSNTGWNLVMKNNIVINPLSHTAVNSANYYTWAAPLAKAMFGQNGLIRKRLEKEIDFRSPPYSTRYPELLPYLDVIQEDKEWQGMRSRGNLLENNVIVGGPENPIELLGGKYAQTDGINNWVTKQDPGFIDMKNKNFALRKDAMVFEKIQGFQPIPFDKMGLFIDEYRKQSQ